MSHIFPKKSQEFAFFKRIRVRPWLPWRLFAIVCYEPLPQFRSTDIFRLPSLEEEFAQIEQHRWYGYCLSAALRSIQYTLCLKSEMVVQTFWAATNRPISTPCSWYWEPVVEKWLISLMAVTGATATYS